MFKRTEDQRQCEIPSAAFDNGSYQDGAFTAETVPCAQPYGEEFWSCCPAESVRKLEPAGADGAPRGRGIAIDLKLMMIHAWLAQDRAVEFHTVQEDIAVACTLKPAWIATRDNNDCSAQYISCVVQTLRASNSMSHSHACCGYVQGLARLGEPFVRSVPSLSHDEIPISARGDINGT